jgi:hypothetical protein
MKTARRRGRLFPGGARLFQRMYARLGLPGRAPQFVVEFYPYVTVKQTLRLREGHAWVRISDALAGAPIHVLEAVAQLLLARAFRIRPPSAAVERFRQYCLEPSTQKRLAQTRRCFHVRPLHEGQNFCLAELFEQLNERYFSGRLRPPELCWSHRPWRVQLGLYDPVLRRITLNRRLDSPTVPSFVVQYVLYHEMVHMRCRTRLARCGFRRHSKQFRQIERRFVDYERARQWLAHWN